MWTRRAALLAPFWQTVDSLPDISSIAQDLQTPPMVDGSPGPGRRVRATLPAYRDSAVYHALYLPRDWKPGGNFPVIVEYAGNGNYRNRFGDVSEGVPEGSNLGFGISGGSQFLWLCLPYVDRVGGRNATTWWGDAQATVEYCKEAVSTICDKFGGDLSRILLCGFSRGAIACNYIGLRDEEIAKLWRGFVCYSHYDGVRAWPYADSDRQSALERLRRLNGRPQFLCHELSVEATREYIEGTGIQGDFTFHALPFRNHNDAWTLRDSASRRLLRSWVRRVTSL